MNQTYKVNIKPIVLTVRPDLNKRYILSSDKDTWVSPVIPLDHELLTDIGNKLIYKMKEFVFTNELELLPQIIKIDHDNAMNDLNIIYGFIIPYTNSLNNCFWIEFDFNVEQPYSKLIIEVAQKLV